MAFQACHSIAIFFDAGYPSQSRPPAHPLPHRLQISRVRRRPLREGVRVEHQLGVRVQVLVVHQLRADPLEVPGRRPDLRLALRPGAAVGVGARVGGGAGAAPVEAKVAVAVHPQAVGPGIRAPRKTRFVFLRKTYVRFIHQRFFCDPSSIPSTLCLDLE